jgi:hypothetical protein
VKVLFIARHFTYFRNYESVIEMLAARGHEVHLAAEREERLGGHEMVERLASAHPGISFGWIPDREDRWVTFATGLRRTIDYLRYLDPAYETTPKLRERARERVPRLALWLLAVTAFRTKAGRRVANAVLRACEAAIPRSRTIDAYVREQNSDVLLLTPLIGVVSSPQPDYLQSAKALGLPAALCVWSWDHLSSKAIVRSVPDRVFVWNETQRDEAVKLHGVPPERVIVTGAQCFDQWFGRSPSTDRPEFCRVVGLRPDRPFILYVCSALFRGSASEALFVERWIRALRSSGLDPLVSTPILVRPHPARTKEWADVDVSAAGDVAVWGRNPVDADAKAEYFDSLYHSAAIVGLNTSAFLEGGVVGRPIFTTLLPEHHENQEGTIHFHYLLQVGGGLLHASRTLGQHFEQLNEALGDGGRESARSRRFVEAFIRPHGLDVAATPVFADAVETLARAPAPEPAAVSLGTRLLQLVMTPVAAIMAFEALDPLVSSERDRAIASRRRARHERAEKAWREKREGEAAEQRDKESRAAARQREKVKRAAEWRRTKMTKQLRGRIKRGIGLER